MATTVLHQQVAAIAADKAALVIPSDALRALLLGRFDDTVNDLSQPIALDGFPAISTRVQRVSITAADLNVQLNAGRAHITAEFVATRPFVITLAIFPTGQPGSPLSTLSIAVDRLTAEISVEDPLIHFGEFDGDIDATIDMDPQSRGTIMQANGLSEYDVASAEGALRLNSRQLVASALGEAMPINVRDLAKNFEFSGIWTAHAIADALVIVPSERFCPSESAECPDVDALPDLQITAHRTDGTLTLDPTGNRPPPVQPASPESEGVVSVYIPKKVFEQYFGKLQPSFTYSDQSRKFIGYRIALSFSFSYVSLSIDARRLGLIAEFHLGVTGSGVLDVAMPCNKRARLADVFITQNGQSILKLFCGLGVDDQSRLRLMSYIDEFHCGDIEADVSAFSRYVSLITGGAQGVLAFATDVLLGEVIAHNAASYIQRKLKKEVNSRNSVFLDLAHVRDHLPSRNFNRRTLSIDDESLLAGLVYLG